MHKLVQTKLRQPKRNSEITKKNQNTNPNTVSEGGKKKKTLHKKKGEVLIAEESFRL